MKTVPLTQGIRVNLGQFNQQLLQVLWVGCTIGMMRTVLPALAEVEFQVPRDSFLLLTTFVVAFGFVKGTLNLIAGRLSEVAGRKRVLVAGWIAAVPIPFVVYYAPTWNWIVAATVLLGVNQGLTWSMTQTAKLDLASPNQRGFAIGLNEFAGYVGLAVAGVVTGYLAAAIGARLGLLVFGLTVIGGALVASLLWVKETLPWAKLESAQPQPDKSDGTAPRYPKGIGTDPTTWEVFAVMTWRDRRLAAISLAGLVEKFVDSLVWIFYPLYLYQRDVSLPGIGWVVGVYASVWGVTQFFTGKLSDHVGRHRPNVWGMVTCGAGVALMILQDGIAWWSLSAFVSGLGMALLYPNLSAAVADISHPNWRGSAIGIYRFWRDLGYGIGAFALGVAAQWSGLLQAPFLLVAVAMVLSGVILHICGEETHPAFAPRYRQGNASGS